VTRPAKLNDFTFSPDDPLAAEHADLVAWASEALSAMVEGQTHDHLKLTSFPSGKKLLDAKPDKARRYVVAAVAQMCHWEREDDALHELRPNGSRRLSIDAIPTQYRLQRLKYPVEAAFGSLIRRSLPFQRDDLLAILKWYESFEWSSTDPVPVGYIVGALEGYRATETSIDSDLRVAMQQAATKMHWSYSKDATRHAVTIEQLCADDSEPDAVDGSDVVARPTPKPGPAGSPHVHVQLKRSLGLLPPDHVESTTMVGPDRFPLCEDSPLRHEHELLTALFEEAIRATDDSLRHTVDYSAERAVLKMKPPGRCTALLAVTERHVNPLLGLDVELGETAFVKLCILTRKVISSLADARHDLPRDVLFDLLLYNAIHCSVFWQKGKDEDAVLISQAELANESSPISEGERYVLWLFRASLTSPPPLGSPRENVMRLTRLIGDGAKFCLAPGDVWSDAVNDRFTRVSVAERRQWTTLFAHMLSATSSRPSAKWLKVSKECIAALGEDAVLGALEEWLPLVSRGQSVPHLGSRLDGSLMYVDLMNGENATCLRGLLWMTPLFPQRDRLARAIAGVARSAYQKIPGVGSRSLKMGNAAVYALSRLASPDAVGQLAMLKARVRFRAAQNELEKAFNKSAEALGLPRDEIEEMSVPTYGLEQVGLCSETLGEYRAELTVSGSNAKLSWINAKGKSVKSVPAKVKTDHGEELKDLTQALKDIQTMLPAQRDRIDSMFLLEKSWPIDVWKERYLDHPLVGTIARRLIWNIDGMAAAVVEGQPVDQHGVSVSHSKTADVTLWHPVGRSIDEVTSWRHRLEELRVTQPFKQAHREVYLLTEAERNTNTYSNRYAAHVIRQHQFNALCAARGWKNRLRLMVDDGYPPATKDLPHWGLRAEFWVEGIGDDYDVDANDSGVFLRLATDQVRFYRTGAAANWAHASGGPFQTDAGGPGQDNVNEPLPLDQIPPLVFSEVMRDVDLFVGVASVGNDPTWQDGGPEGRCRDYWQNYSFGELSGTAATRKQVLERLVPRLKIADRCSFSDRFLVVRGDKRTYKIHLGSGNILMEPNDQYLCIVTDSRSLTKQGDLFLPFEGDGTLSIIISKALLLADDTKITDRTILHQINAQ